MRFQSCAVLSQRLGLGKGGLRMAPEQALGEILQVCVYICLNLFMAKFSEIVTSKYIDLV